MSLALLVLALSFTGSAAQPTPAEGAGAECPARAPVLLVHGIDDDGRWLAPLEAYLRARGFGAVERVHLTPYDGAAPIAVLATQVAEAAGSLRARTHCTRIDVVGFSMGALVTRYYLQKLEGRSHVRRFVSISGPHAGTVLAYTRDNPGARDMRPDSSLLRALAAEPEPFAGVDVFSLWSPLDLMIVPASSSRLPGAHERTFPVPLHPLMQLDGRVLRAVEEALQVARPEDFAAAPRRALPPGL